MVDGDAGDVLFVIGTFLTVAAAVTFASRRALVATDSP
jgi:hypothetical protein